MKGLDDGPDGLDDAAFDRALGVKPKAKRETCPVCNASVGLIHPSKRFRTHERGAAGCSRLKGFPRNYCPASGQTMDRASLTARKVTP